MGSPRPQPVSVRGGSDGTEAHYDDMIEAARLFGHAATDTGGAAISLHAYLLDPGIYSSGLLDPVGTGRFEAELLDALDGPGGLTWLAAECGLLDLDLRAAAAAYLAADRLDTTAHGLLDGAVGLPGALLHGAEELVITGSISRAGNRVLTSDPALLDELVNGLAALPGPLAVGLDALMWDGHAVVREQGADPNRIATAPPRDLAGVMAGLALRNHGRHGEIDVRMLSHADGRRSVIVDIPGTKSWDPRPNSDITSLATDVRALAGHNTSYQQGVLTALERAGVTPSDDVMLVGHSEGGMVAVNAAIGSSAVRRFRVTHVVTAGSPIGTISGRMPRGVRVLALENAADLVPHLDGTANPDKVNVTTATIHRNHGNVLRNHDIDDSYLPGATDVDGCPDASVKAFLASADRFFDATRVRTDRFVITRGY
ncbi:MAG: hypothetical protein JWO57_2962 [Pseudonocardiales bacterium]|nr:hypothetical protein [Pseudonocardiales bacterium]